MPIVVSRVSWPLSIAWLTVALVCVCAGAATGQSTDKTKLETAAARASKAAKVLNDVISLPAGEQIPKELIARARAILVSRWVLLAFVDVISYARALKSRNRGGVDYLTAAGRQLPQDA